MEESKTVKFMFKDSDKNDLVGFELLAYVVAFAICLGVLLAIVGGIFMYFSHKKTFNAFLDRREKMGGYLNANSSYKED